jgi:hypothetical protein
MFVSSMTTDTALQGVTASMRPLPPDWSTSTCQVQNPTPVQCCPTGKLLTLVAVLLATLIAARSRSKNDHVDVVMATASNIGMRSISQPNAWCLKVETLVLMKVDYSKSRWPLATVQNMNRSKIGFVMVHERGKSVCGVVVP